MSNLSTVPFLNHVPSFVFLSTLSFIESTASADCSSDTFKWARNGFKNPEAIFSVFPPPDTNNSHLQYVILFQIIRENSPMTKKIKTALLTGSVLARAGIMHSQEECRNPSLDVKMLPPPPWSATSWAPCSNPQTIRTLQEFRKGNPNHTTETLGKPKTTDIKIERFLRCTRRKPVRHPTTDRNPPEKAKILPHPWQTNKDPHLIKPKVPKRQAHGASRNKNQEPQPDPPDRATNSPFVQEGSIRELDLQSIRPTNNENRSGVGVGGFRFSPVSSLGLYIYTCRIRAMEGANIETKKGERGRQEEIGRRVNNN